MQITLNMNTADHCMKRWFTAGKVYEAKKGKPYNGQPTYRVTNDDGETIDYSSFFFNVVE